MRKKGKQRSAPKGIKLVCDDGFRTNLLELLKTKSAIDIAHEVGDYMGRPVHDSTISRMKNGTLPSSALVAPMCALYHWPMPPVANTSEAVGQAMALIKELEARDQGELMRAVEYLQGAATTVRLRTRK